MKTATVPTSQHTRIHEQLMEHWDACKGKRAIPLESDINPEELSAIWDHCFLIRVADDTFAYQYLGTALTEAYGDNLMGREICESLIYPHPEPLFHAFQRARASAQPVYDENQFLNAKHMVVKYRSCVLPLAAEGQEGVGFLIGAMNWKAY